jgi:hypothetical protein
VDNYIPDGTAVFAHPVKQTYSAQQCCRDNAGIIPVQKNSIRKQRLEKYQFNNHKIAIGSIEHYTFIVKKIQSLKFQ